MSNFTHYSMWISILPLYVSMQCVGSPTMCHHAYKRTLQSLNYTSYVTNTCTNTLYERLEDTLGIGVDPIIVNTPS